VAAGCCAAAGAGQVVEEGVGPDEGGAHLLGAGAARFRPGHPVDPPVAVDVVGVVHGQRGDLLLVVPAVRVAARGGELREQGIGSELRLTRRS
jgi:hypothetical protein